MGTATTAGVCCAARARRAPAGGRAAQRIPAGLAHSKPATHSGPVALVHTKPAVHTSLAPSPASDAALPEPNAAGRQGRAGRSRYGRACAARLWPSGLVCRQLATHTRTHARTHARARAYTHTHTHTQGAGARHRGAPPDGQRVHPQLRLRLRLTTFKVDSDHPDIDRSAFDHAGPGAGSAATRPARDSAR